MQITDEIMNEVTLLAGPVAAGEFAATPEWSRERCLAWLRELPSLDDEQLHERTTSAIHQSALTGSWRGNWNEQHCQASACYHVCMTRDKAEHEAGCASRANRYNRAFNAAVKSQGHSHMAKLLPACTCTRVAATR